MELRRFDEVDDFLAGAGDFLAAREAEHNLIFGICSTLRDSPEAYTGAAVSRGRSPPAIAWSAASIQTPPFRVVLSEIDDPAAIDAARRRPARARPARRARPGRDGAAFVDALAARGGPSRQPRDVRADLSAGGRHAASTGRRAMRASRRPTIATSCLDVARGLHARGVRATPTAPKSPPMTDRWLAGRGRTLLPVGGRRLVSLCGVGGRRRTGSGSGRSTRRRRLRGRGYASDLVRRSARPQLDAGRRFCFLFTDPANPTSNHIYRAIGYEPVRDVDAWRFERAMTRRRRTAAKRSVTSPADGPRGHRPHGASRSSRRRTSRSSRAGSLPRPKACCCSSSCSATPAGSTARRRGSAGPRSPSSWSVLAARSCRRPCSSTTC